MVSQFFAKLALVLGLLTCAIVWVLLELLGFDFKFYVLASALCIVYSISFLAVGVTARKERPIYRNTYVFLGGVLAIIAEIIIMLNAVSDIKLSFMFSIIFLTLVIALVVSFIVSKGKPWDQGDNQKPGYKTYRERKNDEI